MTKVIGRKDPAPDVGTMWTMTRNGYTARCALFSLPREWELRVLVDGVPVVTRRCVATQRALDIAEEWKQRMKQKGWSAVTPPFPLHVA